MTTTTTERPTPAGYKWVYVKSYKHWRSGKTMVASMYGHDAWCFLVRE